MSTIDFLKPLHVVAWVHHGLGDLIMALPTLVAMDERLPSGSQLTCLVKSTIEEQLLRLVQWRKQVEIVNFGHLGAWNYRRVWQLAANLRDRRPDVFIAPHASVGALPPLFARLVGARVSVGPHGKWWRLGFSHSVTTLSHQHKVEYYAEFARSVGLIEHPTTPIRLTLSPVQRRTAGEMLKVESGKERWVIIAPGSGPAEMHKRWPPEKYRNLVRSLTDADSTIGIAIIGSPAEKSLLDDVASTLPLGRGHVVAQPELELTLAIIRLGACVVCSCGGAGHMAALMGTPVVGIYGPTNPSITGPYSPQVRLVRRGYPCSPCYRPGFEHGCGRPICMTDISVDQVVDAVWAVMRKEPFPTLPRIYTTHARYPVRKGYQM